MYEIDRDRIPEAYRPLSAWTYFGLEILYALPIVGWVFLICHAIGSRNINKRSFARSYFCVYVIVILLVIVLLVSGMGLRITGGRNL